MLLRKFTPPLHLLETEEEKKNLSKTKQKNRTPNICTVKGAKPDTKTLFITQNYKSYQVNQASKAIMPVKELQDSTEGEANGEEHGSMAAARGMGALH